jgi:hypothetical protein
MGAGSRKPGGVTDKSKAELMRQTLLLTAVFALAGCASSRVQEPPGGLPDALLAKFTTAESFEIVSLYPFPDHETREEWQSGAWTEMLRDFAVIGAAALSDEQER